MSTRLNRALAGLACCLTATTPLMVIRDKPDTLFFDGAMILATLCLLGAGLVWLLAAVWPRTH